MIKDSVIRSMLYDVVSHLDYDLAKNLNPETAEEPEFAEDLFNEVVSIAESYIGPFK